MCLFVPLQKFASIQVCLVSVIVRLLKIANHSTVLLKFVCWLLLKSPNKTLPMKTPERWRALQRRALFVSILAQKLSKDVKTPCDVMALCRDVMTLHHMISYDMTKWTCPGQPIWKSENYVFQPSDLDLSPITLTFKLIRDIVKVNFSIKFWVCTFNGSAGRALIDTHTHRRDRFHTLDRWSRREARSVVMLAITLNCTGNWYSNCH